MSSLTMLSLLSINLPGEAYIIQRTIINFAQLDLLPSDYLTDKIFEFDPQFNHGLTFEFDDAGFDSMNTIKNLGSTFLYIIFNTALLVLIGILKLTASFSTK